MLPLLATRWHLSDLDAGYLFTAQFLASLITSAASGVFINRLGYRWALFCSLLLMAFGVAMLDQKSWQVGMTAVCIYGAGFGLSSPTGNLWVAEMNPERPAVALNLVNFSWGAGAVGAPLAIAALERSGQVIWTTYATSAAAVALCIWLASARFAAVPAPVKTQRLPHAATEPERMRVLRGQFYSALVLCVLFFTYVGTETSIGGWVAVHARRLSVGGEHSMGNRSRNFLGGVAAGACRRANSASQNPSKQSGGLRLDRRSGRNGLHTGRSFSPTRCGGRWLGWFRTGFRLSHQSCIAFRMVWQQSAQGRFGDISSVGPRRGRSSLVGRPHLHVLRRRIAAWTVRSAVRHHPHAGVLFDVCSQHDGKRRLTAAAPRPSFSGAHRFSRRVHRE